MFALQKPTAKRPAEDAAQREHSHAQQASVPATQPTATYAPWKRVKSEPQESISQQVSHKPMLGAWFGARGSVASQPAPASQAPAITRVKAETHSLSQDSEDDKPLSRLMSQPRDWKQQKQLQRIQAKPQQKTSPAGKAKASQTSQSTGFTSAREVANNPIHETNSSTTKTEARQKTFVSEDERVFEISPKRRVTVRRWKSTVLVDVREFYDDNGVPKPGKKGISLAKDQWRTLMRLSHAINQAVDLVEDDNVDAFGLQHNERVMVSEPRTIAFTLSPKRRITVRYFKNTVLIDLREYYEQGNEMKPGNKGISLSKDQWRSLQEIERDVSEAVQQA